MRHRQRFWLVVAVGVTLLWGAGSSLVMAQGTAATDPVVLERWGIDGYGTLVEMRAAKTLVGSGSEMGRGALRLLDVIDDRTLELGYYEYGAGLFTPSLFEAFTHGFSIRSFDWQTESFLAVRDWGDLRDIRLRHDGTHGIIETTGFGPGGLHIGGNGPNIFATQAGTVLVLDDDGNVGIGPARDIGGGGAGVLAIGEAEQVPVSNSAGGGLLYVERGALKYRGPSGTVTILARP